MLDWHTTGISQRIEQIAISLSLLHSDLLGVLTAEPVHIILCFDFANAVKFD